jgi:hypothetical protein
MAATTIDPTPNAGDERPSGKATTEPAAPVAPRIHWRAIVRTGGQVAASRERDRVEWHLAACTAPRDEANHCTEGRHLVETSGHPDGHCIVNGVCGLCGAAPPPPDA